MLCSRCGEQWDLDSLHEEVSTRYPSELAALEAKYENHPRRHQYGDPHQVEYEKLFNTVRADFRKRGCVALGGSASYCQPDERTPQRAVLNDAIFDLMGDDCDGAESMLEDAQSLGLF